MVVIERKDSYGYVDFRSFERLKDAFNFLKSDEVKKDMKDGSMYSFKEEDDGGNPDGG